MSKTRSRALKNSSVKNPPAAVLSRAGDFARRALAWGAGLLCVLISASFFTGTYDTAQAKDTLLLCGGGALVLLWAALLAEEKRLFITRANAAWYLPFLGFYGLTLVSLCWSPYRTEAWPEFFRYAVYFGLSLVALAQFRGFSVRTLTKCVTAAAWVSYGYGFLQAADRFLPGIDFMPWRAFFGPRVFSTQANPNFFGDFIVFSSFIVLAEYLRTRKKSLLVLYALGLADLFFTQSKGAWVAFGAVFGLSAVAYVNYFSTRLRAYRRRVNAAAAAVALCAALLAGVYALKRTDSVGFRVHTWTSAFSMVQDAPVLGTGVGSFKTIYPAYRKPQIFFMENAHNTETQHPENELLEQWATVGTLGLAVFLWMMFFVFFAAHKRLVFWRGENRPEAYWLWGYACALAGILIHNMFDVSLRFASTGVFFALFLGAAAALARPDFAGSCAASPAAGDGVVSPARARPGAAVWALRLAVWAALAWAFFALAGKFAEVTGSLAAVTPGDVFLKAAAWGVFFAASLGTVFITARAAGLFARPQAQAALLLVPLAVFWGFKPFLADHYYGVAAGFAARGQADGALDYFHKAIEQNPLNTAYRQYRATMMATRLDFSKTFNAKKGDTDAATTDYERVKRDLDAVRAASPNHALLYQAYGEFYYASALKFSDLARTAADTAQYEKYKSRALEDMARAQENFEYSLLLDPVNQATYAYLSEIAVLRRRPDEARAWVEKYRRGPAGVTEKEFLDRMRLDPRAERVERRINAAFGTGK